MSFISDILTNISAFRIKVGEKLNWLNANKADTTALADYVKKDGSVEMTGTLRVPAVGFPAAGGVQGRNYYLQPNMSFIGDFSIYSTDYQGLDPVYSQFYISTTGRIGLGTDSPQAKLHVNGNAIVDDATANNHAVTLGQASLSFVKQGGNTHTGSNIYLGWNGSRLDLQVDLTYQGYLWHSGNFNPANYAQLSQVYTQSQALGLFVGLNGVQTISDTKTFTNSPVVPNGTLAGHTVNLGQLNTLLAIKANTSGYYGGLQVGYSDNSGLWSGQTYSTSASGNPLFFMVYDDNSLVWRSSSLTEVKNALGFGNYVLQTSLNTQLANYVTVNAVQNITATKTFTVSPIVPNGTLSGHTVNLGQLLAQITNLDLAPKAHKYQVISTNGTAIDVSEFRRAVITFENPSVTSAALPNDVFPGTVVTLQTTSVQVDVTMDYRKTNSSGSMLSIEAYKSVQVSYSEDQNAWIVEQDNSLS